MSEIDKEKFPTLALYAAGAIIVLAVGAAAMARYDAAKYPLEVTQIQEPVAQTVDLTFDDQDDGSVLVKDASTRAVIMTLRPGEDAFIRAVIRGFVRDRNARKLGKDIPFRLYRLVDTRLVVEDIATHRRVHLRAFGPTQQAAFARLLPAQTGP
jgi:putative photosynthetic complex assembly protein